MVLLSEWAEVLSDKEKVSEKGIRYD